MSFVYLESWPYDEVADSKSKATDLYDKLRAALEGPTPAVPFPYDAACEVALIETPDWWMVAVGGAPADPKLVDRMETWFKACGGVQQPTTSETHDVGDSSLTEVAVARGWGRVVSSI